MGRELLSNLQQTETPRSLLLRGLSPEGLWEAGQHGYPSSAPATVSLFQLYHRRRLEWETSHYDLNSVPLAVSSDRVSRSGRVSGSSESVCPRPWLIQLPLPYDFRQHRVRRPSTKQESAPTEQGTLREMSRPPRCASLSPRHCPCSLKTPSPGRLEMNKDLEATEEALRSLQEYHRLLLSSQPRRSTS